MQPKLFDRLIETSIAPIANWERVGDVLKVRIVRPDTGNPELECLQRGAKFDLHIDSPAIIQNLEYHGVVIDEEVRSDIIRAIRGEELAGITETIDGRGTKFDPSIHEVDIDGNPVLTSFKTFKRIKVKSDAPIKN